MGDVIADQNVERDMNPFELMVEILAQLQKLDTPMQPSPENFTLPSILTRRNVSLEMQSHNRVLDDVEMTLLGILDSTGMLSLCSRISEFIIIMTRVVKVEHRALCLYILSNCMTSKSGQIFINYGGLRLLKRWIKVAEDEDCVDELQIIVTLCKLLPFDGQAIKETEIGKSIRKLLKFKSNSTNIEALYTEVKDLMLHWTNHVKKGVPVPVINKISEKISGINSPQSTKTQPNNAFNSSNTLEQKNLPEFVKVKPEVITDVPIIFNSKNEKIANNLVSSKNTDIDTTSISKTISAATVTQQKHSYGVLDALASGKTNPPAASTAVTSSAQMLPGTGVNLGLGHGFGSRLGGLGLEVRTGTAPIISAAKRTSLDGVNIMAEKAKILLQNQQNQLKSSSLDNLEPSVVSVPEVSILPLMPLRGGMKRKNRESLSGSVEGEENGKRARMSVQWADENGGTLRDVMTFEVERIKNTIKDYKSHRDLVRKERQLEKDLHLSKTKEVMHPAIEWRKPDELVLSIDIRYLRLIAPIVSLSHTHIHFISHSLNHSISPFLLVSLSHSLLLSLTLSPLLLLSNSLFLIVSNTLFNCNPRYLALIL